eukprot:12716748-Heterocapsa_arctica.AAC.1
MDDRVTNSPSWGMLRRNIAARLAAAAPSTDSNGPGRQRAHLVAGAQAIIAAEHTAASPISALHLRSWISDPQRNNPQATPWGGSI